jgi:hypothetical protein
MRSAGGGPGHATHELYGEHFFPHNIGVSLALGAITAPKECIALASRGVAGIRRNDFTGGWESAL